MSHRVKLITANVFETIDSPPAGLSDADLVMSFMMLHDLFNAPELEKSLFTRLRTAFPNARYFALADTCLDETVHTAGAMPVFTQGFELIHRLRGIQVYPLGYYEQRFKEGGLRLLSRHYLGVPNTYLFILEAQ